MCTIYVRVAVTQIIYLHSDSVFVMDTSPVQSSSKCGSDFSIERILSSDSRRSDNADVPDWLCCTRYRPPRLPRAVIGGRARRSGRHARVPFTVAQAAALEAAYARAPYLAPPALRALAAALQLRDDRIKIWFQNRRARERREKCVNITPPVAVTLPPTTTPVSLSYPITNSTWTQNDMQIPFNMTMHNSQEKLDRVGMYVRDKNTSEVSSLSESTDDDRPDSPLDIESIED
ncbi:homeobox protein MSX-1-like [Trichoplusia ni]|uniref:Homeobox protein MSX-1-like n=1 Tax=Trichoplusia ni TaxID=7111 RepID=A0A7E5W210_TRINI|nr:homeobox protein MSX-1-like [Trichoplusia ni]